MFKKIADSTLERLSKYIRALEFFIKNNKTSISSEDLADQGAITSAQVRKDLSFFGTFGKRGIGYNTSELHKTISNVLGLDKNWNLAIVGAGNIGKSLINFNEFRSRGFIIRGVFDSDPKKIGLDVNGFTIHKMDDFTQRIKHLNIHIGIIAVTPEHAQNVADLMISSGITAILNFAPKNIKVPEGIIVRNTNITVNLEKITFHLNQNS
jgi:redox-sensing transcriptional repressor